MQQLLLFNKRRETLFDSVVLVVVRVLGTNTYTLVLYYVTALTCMCTVYLHLYKYLYLLMYRAYHTSGYLKVFNRLYAFLVVLGVFCSKFFLYVRTTFSPPDEVRTCVNLVCYRRFKTSNVNYSYL